MKRYKSFEVTLVEMGEGETLAFKVQLKEGLLPGEVLRVLQQKMGDTTTTIYDSLGRTGNAQPGYEGNLDADTNSEEGTRRREEGEGGEGGDDTGPPGPPIHVLP